MCVHSGCATVAEFHMRGDDFWGEFEFYLSDMVVGFVLDVALVTMLAPVSIIGAKPSSSNMTGSEHRHSVSVAYEDLYNAM